MFQAVKSPYLVPFKGPIKMSAFPTAPPGDALSKKKAKDRLEDLVQELDDLQHRIYADDRFAVLLIFQAMDAAGKDGTIRAVLSGVNPVAFQVTSFKQPSANELDHDFLWRTVKALPERGRIGVFNRSYYEEVLVVRVHPEYLEPQNLPWRAKPQTLWKQRYDSIRDHELHLARSGTVVLKFWLNVSRKEQRRRFLSRIDDADKRWKFSNADVAERAHWPAYMKAYREMLPATSRPWAPWYAIPADEKPFMRLTVARILVESLRSLNCGYPRVSQEREAELLGLRSDLAGD
jgi:PPK2 family polyphosphate:nucleotide phosphotransferase